MPPQELGVGTEIQKKYKGRVVLWSDIVKYDSGSDAAIYRAGFISITNDVRKSSGCTICKGGSGQRMGKTRENTGMASDESQKQKKVINEARKEGRTVHFASLVDICHLKNSELEPKFQKYKGQVVLRGDIVKDDSGSFAVFTEQGSSASQMTAAKVMDVSARLPAFAG